MGSVARMIPPPENRRDPVHYHIILSGVLQVRFAQLVKLLALVAWGMSLVVGIFNSIGWIWWLLPFRAFPLLLSAISVSLLRKATIRTDALAYPSLVSELSARVLSRAMVGVVVAYTVASILFFSLIKGQLSNLSLTVSARHEYELPRLNERLLFVNSYILFVGVAYSILHVIMDYDLLRFPMIPLTVAPRKRIEGRLADVTILSAIYATGAVFVFPLIYWMFRNKIWISCLFFSRIFFRITQLNDYVVSFPLSLGLFVQLYASTFFVVWLWEFTNNAFSVYMSLGPLHRGVAISEKSKDPNGTLVTGLKALRRHLTRLIAFQELLYISVNNRDRRIAIFKDIDKNTGIWRQICQECILVLDEFIAKFVEPSLPEPQTETKKEFHQEFSTTAGVLRARQENIFAPSSKDSHQGSVVGRNAKRILIDNLQDKSASRSVEAISFFNWIWALLFNVLMHYKTTLQQLLHLPIGYPFRATLNRKINSLLPNPTLLTCTILALSDMICQSKTEDRFGIVQRDIPRVIDRLDRIIVILEDFMANPPYHWSDVYSKDHQPKDIEFEKLIRIQSTTYTAFEQIIFTFAECLDEIPLSANVKERANEVLSQDLELESSVY